MIERLLRATAIAIAIAGAVDPAFTASRAPRPPLAIVVVPAASMALPSWGGSRAATARSVADRLTQQLGGWFDIHGAPGPSTAAVVLIGDRPPATLETAGATRVSAIDVSEPLSPNVAVTDASATDSDASRGTRVSFSIDAAGMAGRTGKIRLLAGRISLAEIGHTWSQDRETFDGTFDAVASGPGLDLLDVEAVPDGSERTTLDNTRRVAVYSTSRVLRVLFYDARPSWSSTFLRRAIEGRGGFDVLSLTRVSRGVSVRAASAASASLDRAALAGVDLLVVGAPDALSRNETDTIADFVERGGSLLLAPDRRLQGATLSLMPDVSFQERLLETPVEIRFRRGPLALKASELLVSTTLPPLTEPVSSVATPAQTGDTIVTRSPRGRGYVYFSGALDAWRYRADASARFDAVAGALMHEAASQAQPPISVVLSTRLQTVDRAIDVLVRIRDAGDATATASATLTLPDGTTRAVRLWPGAEPGTFTGHVAPSTPGRHTLTVSDGASTAQTLFAARTAADVDRDQSAALRAIAAAHGGRVYRPAEVDRLVSDLQDLAPPARQTERVHPMRSPWWLLPFAACLSGEWWLRRKRGER